MEKTSITNYASESFTVIQRKKRQGKVWNHGEGGKEKGREEVEEKEEIGESDGQGKVSEAEIGAEGKEAKWDEKMREPGREKKGTNNLRYQKSQ